VQVQTLVVAMTGLHVLAGPILFRAALARAGEIGQLDAGYEADAGTSSTSTSSLARPASEGAR
jgi:hypothetical protein